MTHDVFISYSSYDQKIVEALSHFLEERGVRCFVAYRDIPKGKVWASSITEAIENCQLMVVIFSKDFNLSNQVDREIELCSEEKKPILTFRIQDEELKGAKKYYLKNLNWIDAFPNPNECFQSLYESISKLINVVDNSLVNEFDTNKLQNEDKSKNESSRWKLNRKLFRFLAIGIFSLVIIYSYLEISYNNETNINFIETVNGVSFTMVFIDGGTFLMGSSENELDRSSDENQHRVTLAPYFIGKTEVTQALWKAIMGNNPSCFKGDSLPVEHVSWDDCRQFIQKLNHKTGKKYSLPTEAQWEFAARGGTISKGFLYAGSNYLNEVAWHDGNSEKNTHSVGLKKSNELGIYDMSGNVWEWCQDGYDCYSDVAQKNPVGIAVGTGRVFRGGGWCNDAEVCRVACRSYFTPDLRFSNLGFRLVLSR